MTAVRGSQPVPPASSADGHCLPSTLVPRMCEPCPDSLACAQCTDTASSTRGLCTVARSPSRIMYRLKVRQSCLRIDMFDFKLTRPPEGLGPEREASGHSLFSLTRIDSVFLSPILVGPNFLPCKHNTKVNDQKFRWASSPRHRSISTGQ